MAINNPVITSADTLQGIAEEIQAKDGGGKMLDTEMRGRIAALLVADPYEMLEKALNETAIEIISDNINQLTSYLFYDDEVLKRVILKSENFNFSFNSFKHQRALSACNALRYVIIPKSKGGKLGTYLFSGSSKLDLVVLHNIDDGGGSTFTNCSNLKSLFITGDKTPPSINANSFNGTGILNGTGYVYVLDTLKSSYQTATGWAAISSQILGFSEAIDYDSSTTYSLGDVCKYNGKIYTWANEVNGNTIPIGSQYDINEDWYCVINI